nr:serine hydrolase domain-containing protein [Nonomuraea sp. NEAU-A123]
MFAPGRQYSYSNTNVALGLIAEKVTEQSLGDLIQERIAKPLNLKNTYLPTGIGRPDNRGLAHGYEPDAAHIAPLLPPGTPAGTKFAGPGRAGKLLPPAQLKQMRTTVAEEPGNPNRYGLGLEKVVTPCGAVWGHVAHDPLTDRHRSWPVRCDSFAVREDDRIMLAAVSGFPQSQEESELLDALR